MQTLCVYTKIMCACVYARLKNENLKKGIGVYSHSNGRPQAVAGEVSGGSEETTQPERDTWSQRWDLHCLGWAPCTKVTVCSLPHCWQEFWEFITHLVQQSMPSVTTGTHPLCLCCLQDGINVYWTWMGSDVVSSGSSSQYKFWLQRSSNTESIRSYSK